MGLPRRSASPKARRRAFSTTFITGDAMADTAALQQMGQKLRRHSVTSTTEAGSGHPTTCMSCADIMSVLFFHEMRFDPKNPKARNVDEFVMSKGHGAPILWAALK